MPIVPLGSPARRSGAACLVVLAVLSSAVALAQPAGSWILPSAVFRAGANGAEFRSDVRILNPGRTAVTVTASFHDQASGETVPAKPFEVAARSQASFDNVLESLFGRTSEQGSFGPVRFEATGPVVVSSSVNNVNGCGTGAVSGQWLPGLDVARAMKAGVLGQLATSGSPSTGYRTNVVFVNPGPQLASVNAAVRRGGGSLLSSGTVGTLAANGFRQVELDNATVFPGVAGTTDTNLWLEFTSDQPVLAFASVIDNASGDPFAVLAIPDPATSTPAAEEITISLPGGVPLVMVRIPAGRFQMGSLENERGRQPDEGPQHEVTIGHDYYIGKYEVTQAQWRAVMGSIPGMGHGAGDSYPVYYVSWNDVAGPGGFLEKVNSTLGPSKLRLPTEAEWEYAARAGTTAPFSFGDDPSCAMSECGTCALFNQYMWCSGSLTGYGSRPVGQKAANLWGLHDMHGNVWEWVHDCYHSSYAGAPTDGSAWLVPASADRVLRGGNWHGPAYACRSANRAEESADFLRVVNGFRVARSSD